MATANKGVLFQNASIQISDNELNQAVDSVNQLLARKDLGFFEVPQRQILWNETKQVAEKLRKSCSELVVVGIGGSGLGPRVIQEVFQSPKSSHGLHFCDNVDAAEFQKLFASLKDPSKTAWAFVSKSGSTIETLVSLDFIHQEYAQNKWGTPNSVVVTEKKASPLYDWAISQKLDILEIPLDVGGRFSVLTAVGMLPAAFLGLNIDQIQAGAKLAIEDKKNVAALVAQTLKSWDRGEWITLFWTYSSHMKHFGMWQQQLWAESLAKTKDRKGNSAKRCSTPVWAVGACDQHSILQQVMEGAKDKFVIFTRVESAEGGTPLKESQISSQSFFIGKTMGQLLGAEAQATQMALMENGVKTLGLKLSHLNEHTLGYWFMYWMLVVGALGEAMDINAFDQPGVELGKRLAKEILKTT